MKINVQHQTGDDLLTEEQEALFCRWAESVYRERVKQVAKWGDQRHPDGTGLMFTGGLGLANYFRNTTQLLAKQGKVDWAHILLEEVYEGLEEDEEGPLTGEMRQMAAVLAAWWADIQSRRE